MRLLSIGLALSTAVSVLLWAKVVHAYVPTSAYERLAIYEWTVLVSPEIAARADLKRTMVRNLTAQLSNIRSKVRPRTLQRLAQAKIWLELESRSEDGHFVVGQYFTSRTWLRNNGVNPDKFEGVQLNALFARDGTGGTIVFHELAHVYHDLKLGNSNRLQRLWENAWLANPNATDNCGRREKPYAFFNPSEFFATYSQAYIGSTCAFPYNRETLRRIDPKAYAFMERTWGSLAGQ